MDHDHLVIVWTYLGWSLLIQVNDENKILQLRCHCVSESLGWCILWVNHSFSKYAFVNTLIKDQLLQFQLLMHESIITSIWHTACLLRLIPCLLKSIVERVVQSIPTNKNGAFGDMCKKSLPKKTMLFVVLHIWKCYKEGH